MPIKNNFDRISAIKAKGSLMFALGDMKILLIKDSCE